MKKILFTVVLLITGLWQLTAQTRSSGISPSFTMDTKNPEITLTSPNGGESLNYLQPMDVAWTATDDGFGETPISAGLSTEESGAVSWLSNNLQNSGTTQLNPPDIATEYAKAHIKAVDAFGNEAVDASDEYFELVEPFVADFSAEPLSGTAPLSVQFTDLSTGAITAWAWDFDNDGVTDSQEQNPTWLYTEPGTYTVKLEIFDGGPVKNYGIETKVDYITVSEGLVADFSIDYGAGHAPVTVNFTDQSTGNPVLWAWDFNNDGTIDSNEQNPSWTYTEAGNYDVSLEVQNVSGDTDYILYEQLIVVEDPLIVDFIATPTTVNVGDTVFFTDLTTGPVVAWHWDLDYDGIEDSEEQNPYWVYTEPGLYSVQLEVWGVFESFFELKTDYIEVVEESNPQLTITPPALDFGTLQTDPELDSTLFVTVKNTGTGTLVLDSLFGLEAPFETLISPPAGGLTEFEVPPGDSLLLPITLNRNYAAGDYWDTLMISNNSVGEPVNLDEGLVAYYPFNGNANDESGNGNNGTVYGAMLNEDRFGNVGSAFYFDGNDVIHIPHSESISPENTITVAAWVNPNSVEHWHQVVTKRYSENNSPYNSYILTTSAEGINNKWGFESSFVGSAKSLSPIVAQTWSFLAGTYDGSSIKLFVNGEMVNSSAKTGNIEYTNLSLRIGQANPTLNFKGLIDDVRIYNRALSDAEIQALYYEGTGNGGVMAQVTVHAILTEPTPELTISPVSLSFGEVTVGEIQNLPLTLTNTGSADLVIESISYTEPFFAMYSGTIPPGGSQTIDVSFAPQAAIFYIEDLVFHTNIGDTIVPLTGIGEPPLSCWQFSLSSHNFGWVDIETGALQNLTITNCGSQALQVSGLVFGDEVFDISPSEFSLSANQSQTVQISFNPMDIAWYSATIQFTSNAGTRDIILEGKGYFASAPPQLTFVEEPPYNGTSGVSPEIGPPGTFFEYRVVYSDADNNPPMNTYPKVGIDFNGDGDFLDPGESLASISEVDQTDLNFADGKEYSLITNLPVNSNLGYQFFAYDSLGNPAQGEAAAYKTGPVVSDDELDLALYANDIWFSNANPEVGDEVVINATIRNTSDYPAADVPVSVYIMNELVYETVLSAISPQSTAGISFNYIFAIPDYYPVKVVIDEMNLLGEGNRFNNSAIRPVLVGEFSIPGAIAVSSFLNGSTAYPYGTLRFYGHASYENTKFRNSNVSGAQVVMTIHETGATFTGYTNGNGDYSIYFAVPGNLGSYSVSAEITDFTLTASTSTHGFSVVPIINPYDPPPPEPTYLADLVIYNSGISWSGNPVVNAPNTISATLFNQGNLEAEDVAVLCRVDGLDYYQTGFTSIAAGGSQSISFDVSFDNVGNHSVQIILDPLQTIPETIESNNLASKSRYIYLALPDLTPIELTFSDNSPLGGQVFSISTKVKNLNWATSGATSVSFYEGADNLLGTLPLPEIGGGQTKTLTLSGQSLEISGWHAIKVLVDEGNAVDETNEANQQLSKNIYIEQAMAELSLSGITASNYNPLPGDPMNFMATVTNNGSADAGAFYVKFSMDDVLLGDSVLISGLAIGESQSITSSIWNMEEGIHQVCIEADANNQVPELNEYNNKSCKTLGIDLLPSIFPYYPGNSTGNRLTILKGSMMELNARISNNGCFRANDAEVSFVMDNEILETDVIPFINGGSFAEAGVLHQFEDLGDFTIQIITDFANVMNETNESNNVAYLYIHVYEDQPDMMILSQHIAPSSINPEQYEVISINATCFNIGNVSSGAFDVNLIVDNLPLGDAMTIQNIEPGEEASVGWADIYSTGEIGNHIIKVVLDKNNMVAEINELNNEATRAIIVGDAPDLYLESLVLSNDEPALGELMQITTAIVNNGGADADASLQLFYITLTDTILINTAEFSLLKNQSTEITMDWYAQVQVGFVMALISGSNPPEANLSNNSALHYFGGEMQIASPIADVEVDEDTPTFEVADFMQVFENVDETAMSFEVICNEVNVLLEIDAENKLEMSLTENWNGETSAIVIARNIYNGMVSDTFLITVNPVNDAPIANAGPDQRVPEERPVYLDASASYDIDSPEISWLWTAPEGIVLDDATLENPSFIAPAIDVETIFEIVLVVNDGELDSEPDTLQISVFPVEDQMIGLNYGFQIVSSHLIPLNPDFKTVMTDVLDNLDFARNNAGSQLIKFGPVWVNQIGNWATTQGYLVRMNAGDDLTLTGEVINPQTPITLNQGFSLIAYLPREAMDAQFAFAEILDHLQYARNSSGAQLIKFGPMWVNQIGNLNPGEGYVAKMTSADVLIYPEVPDIVNPTQNSKSEHFRLQNGNPAEAVWTVCFDPSMFAPGDEIGIFDGDVLVGAGVIRSENPYLNFVPVFSNLYQAGNTPLIKVWSQAGKYEYVLSDYSFENPFGDAWTNAVFPEEDGRYSLVSNVTTGLEAELSGSSDVRIFPNPASAEVFVITPCQQEVSVEILNQLGKTCIETQVSQNQNRVNISGLASGIYLIKITCQNTKVVKKLVVE